MNKLDRQPRISGTQLPGVTCSIGSPPLPSARDQIADPTPESWMSRMDRRAGTEATEIDEDYRGREEDRGLLVIGAKGTHVKQDRPGFAKHREREDDRQAPKVARGRILDRPLSSVVKNKHRQNRSDVGQSMPKVNLRSEERRETRYSE